MSEPSPSPPRPLSRLALVSLVLGVLSLLLLIVTGVPALLLGYRSLYQINASDGRLRGRGLAIGGMLLGALGSLAAVAWLMLVILANLWRNSDRLECANNLRLIGRAVALYTDKTQDKIYPRGTLPAEQLAPEQRLSWLVAILPLVDATPNRGSRWAPIAQAIDSHAGWDDPRNRQATHTPIPRFLCPAALAAAGGPRPADTSYIGLAGVGRLAPTYPRDNPLNGVFGYDRETRAGDVQAGFSYTLLAAETSQQIGPWAAGGPATVRGVDPKPAFCIGPGLQFGGLHEGGLNTLWLDGSVRFQTADLPAHLFAEWTRLARAAAPLP